MDSKIEKKNNNKIQEIENLKGNSVGLEKLANELVEEEIEDLCDENLTSLQKIHSILLNCGNLSKNQKLEFCESERYFMKLYLKKLMKQNEK